MDKIAGRVVVSGMFSISHGTILRARNPSLSHPLKGFSLTGDIGIDGFLGSPGMNVIPVYIPPNAIRLKLGFKLLVDNSQQEYEELQKIHRNAVQLSRSISNFRAKTLKKT